MKDIFNIIFWIFLIIGILLLLWNIFGKSPTELYVILPFLISLLFKTWSISDRQLKLEGRFNALARDFKGHIQSKK